MYEFLAPPEAFYTSTLLPKTKAFIPFIRSAFHCSNPRTGDVHWVSNDDAEVMHNQEDTPGLKPAR